MVLIDDGLSVEGYEEMKEMEAQKEKNEEMKAKTEAPRPNWGRILSIFSSFHVKMHTNT